jgi:hypothetical protein
MKIDRIKFSKEFPTSIGTSEWLSMEGPLIEGDDPIESTISLMQKVIEAHKQANKHLYPNGTEALVNGFGEVKVIKREYERLTDNIADCKSIEELAVLKPGLPVDLMPAYMNKLKSLTNGLVKSTDKL